MFSRRIRTFNKHVTNRVLHGLTGLSRGPFAIIHHVGRRSGKPYETVIMVWPLGEDFVIALTYGPEVDWYRNVLAAGHCSISWHKKTYTLGKPEPIEINRALPAFPPLFRRLLPRFGVHDFVRLKRIASTSHALETKNVSKAGTQENL